MKEGNDHVYVVTVRIAVVHVHTTEEDHVDSHTEAGAIGVGQNQEGLLKASNGSACTLLRHDGRT